jgi:hypothetical protein
VINTTAGTPVVGYVSLSNGAVGPTAFTLFTVMGQASYTLQSKERIYVTNITVSSSDTNAAPPLITIDSGGTTPTKWVNAYVSAAKPLQPIQIPPGVLKGIFNVVPRATAASVTATTTVEIVIKGYISTT